MAWPNWDPQAETYVQYLERNHNNPNVFQEGASSAPAPGSSGGGMTETAPGWKPGQPNPNADFDIYLKANPNARDAWSYLESLLNEYGLGDLMNFARENIIEGRSSNEVVQRLRTTDTYKKRFAVIEQRKAANLPPMSEQEVIAYEKQATQLMRSAGLPAGFWDEPEDFLKLQVNDISLTELQGRINDGFTAASQAPADVRAELRDMYGVDDGGLAAFFLDPDRTEAVLMKQFNASQRAAQATRSGFGKITAGEAEQLTAMGVSNETAAQGFGKLNQQRELFGQLPGQSGDNITREQQFAAAFGNNTEAQQQIEREARKRAAAFSGSGGYSQSQQGTTGIGTAR